MVAQPSKRALPVAEAHTRPTVWRSLLLSFVLSGGCYLRHGLAEERADAGGRTDAGSFDASRTDAGSFDASRADAGSFDASRADACVGPGCEVVVDFDGLRWELPCEGEPRPGDRVCDTAGAVTSSFRARGEPGARYSVTLRFRGVVETAMYVDGVANGPFHSGGRHYGGAWNLYALDIESPRETYFLNSGTEGEYVCVPIDYIREVVVASGSNVVLRAESFDDAEIINRDGAGDPIIIPDVPPYPDPFDGQFIQMDVVAVRRAH